MNREAKVCMLIYSFYSFKTWFPYIPYQGYKALIEVVNEKELEHVLKNIIHAPSFLEQYRKYYEEFIRDFCYRLDGSSTSRFISTLERIVET